MSTKTEIEGSYLMPAFEHALVSDVMRVGVITCAPDTPLSDVARIMSSSHVHCVVVTAPGASSQGGQPWGIVSDLDLAQAALDSGERDAGSVCTTEVVTVGPGDSLERAAQLMVEHENSHLVVVDPTLNMPVGVISTLDIAGNIAWGRA
jgi:CBS domain-containing protein